MIVWTGTEDTPLPIDVHGVGVYFKSTHQPLTFDTLMKEHKFSPLTESNKDGEAYRSGVYLTESYPINERTTIRHLMRCSTNFKMPTEDFSWYDRRFVSNINNNNVNLVMARPAHLNHVLAQKYNNVVLGPAPLSRKSGKPPVCARTKTAVIKAHSDKTKDMNRRDGVLAFCTFYEDSVEKCT
jgi:hypothetical protein